jgi:hypothetical protein
VSAPASCSSDIVCNVHSFILELLGAICADPRVRENILSVLMDPIIEQYRKALEHVKFITKAERAGSPLLQIVTSTRTLRSGKYVSAR